MTQNYPYITVKSGWQRLSAVTCTVIVGLSLFSACTNKDLWWGAGNGADQQAVDVHFEWNIPESYPDGYTPWGTMRVNLFSRTAEFPSYGISDFTLADGDGMLLLPVGASYRGVAYSYNANSNIYFRNENDSVNAEAYSATMSRSTYTRAFPNERTAASISEDALFNVAQYPCFDVVKRGDNLPDTMTYQPQNVLYTYTFEVLNVQGAEYVTDTRGALSGMSASYFLTRGTLSASPVTLFFAASVDVKGHRIYGSFSTFGRLDMENNFTLEILHKSSTNGILQYTWNITPQIDKTDGNNHYLNFHIVIDGSSDDGGPVIVPPDDSSADSGGFTADVDEWNEETIQLN
ncbi:MAG: DUF5119 domain-containing protein [Prevotellaceae bacterium]|nr:DUF5119 domain-containing protein [Prevotellaceae bacterium]